MCDEFICLVLQTAQTTTIAAASTNANSATTITATPSTASTVTTSQSPAAAPAPGSIEASLLAGQPPGTVIKCVTAQVIQTTEGPRIVLQGLQGADFTAQQLSMVQAQVKQQLLKGEHLKIFKHGTRMTSACAILKILYQFAAHATTGKQGVLGPTKIYLAVQPAQSSNNQQQQQQQSQPQPQTSQASSTASTPVASTPKQQQSTVSPPLAAGTQSFHFCEHLINIIFRISLKS